VDAAVVNGLFLRLAGARDGAPLVLLHAVADSGLAFAPLFDTPLADRHRLIVVDLAGFGASPRQEGVRTMTEHAGLFPIEGNLIAETIFRRPDPC